MNKQTIFFWQAWESPYRQLYWLLFALLIICLLAVSTVYFAGLNWAITWSSQMELNSIPQAIGEVVKGPFQIPVEGKIYVLEELFQPSNLQMNSSLDLFYGGAALLVVLLILSVLPGLSSWYFAGGMTGFVFFLSFLKLDYLEINLQYPQIGLILSFALYLPIALLLHYYRKRVGLLWRLLIFTGLTAALLVLVPNFSPVASPYLHLVHYGSLALLALSLVFILLTAHEVPAFFLRMLLHYNPRGSYQNLLHFVVLSIIYLSNLVLLYLRNTGELILDIYYIDVFGIFFFSIILGVWGYAYRQELTAKWLPFAPLGAITYIALALICLLTLGFTWLSDNSSWKDVFTDGIVYSYIAAGFAFFLMVTLNFAPLMRRNLKVSPEAMALYRGQYFPVNLARFAAVVILFALFNNNNQMLYYQSIAGYYSTVGDFFYHQKDLKMAKAHYDAGVDTDYYSPRLRYALADIAQASGNSDSLRFHLREALFRKNSPFAYARLANYYYAVEQSFDPLFTLREAVGYFPEQAEIHNNLAFFYARNNVLDSAIYHFEKAKNNLFNSSAVPANNFWAMLARHEIEGFRPDSLPLPPQLAQNTVGRANYLAAFTRYQLECPLKAADLGKIEEANPATFAYIYNYGQNRFGRVDTLLDKQLKQYQDQDSSLIFGHRPSFIRAAYDYYQGKTDEGIRLLAAIPTIRSDAYYNKVLGLWLLEQNAYAAAITYLDKAAELGEADAIYYKAILLSEAGRIEPARELWAKLSKSKVAEQGKMANLMLNVLQDSVNLGDDQEKFAFIHYQRYRLPSKVLEQVFVQITNPEEQHRAAASLIDALLDRGEQKNAQRIYQSLEANAKVSAFARSALNEMYLKLLVAQKQYDKILQEIDNLQMLSFHQNIKPYYRARALEGKKDYENAETYYMRAKASRPFDETVLLSVANFLDKYRKKPIEAYKVLAGSLRLNPFSLEIYKAYALQSIKAGMEYYGEDALEEIQKMSNPEEYQAFEQQFEKEKNAYRAKILAQP